MAEFALGLTKTAVEGTLSLVKSALEEEKKLREAVQNDLVFITGEFEVMQSFLHVANRERAASDVVALTLVRQLRTLAFDVEDCVEYVVHLDLDKSSVLGGLRRAWQTVNCRAPPLPLDVAVAEIKQLKARVEDVSQRNTRYNLILNSSDDNKQQQHHVTITAEPPPPPYATSAFHVLRDAWKATGKWSSNMCDFRQELLVAREGDLRVTSVWRSTTSSADDDLGTASIFSKAYCDPAICEKFRRRAWVKLTHPFNHDDFVKSLLTQLCASSHQANNVEFTQGNLMRAKKAMMQQMRSQRYLVVLEDVLTVAEWDVIRMYLPESKNGSRILLSTPHLSIALLCTGEPYQVSELRKFSSDNQFLCAFSKKEKV
jgi:hypothetical protein